MGCYGCGSSEGDCSRLCPPCNERRRAERSTPRFESEVPPSPLGGGNFNALGLGAIAVVSIAMIFFYLRSSGMPTVEDCEASIRAYLGRMRSCENEAQFETFSISAFEKFDPKSESYLFAVDYRAICSINGAMSVIEGASRSSEGRFELAGMVRRTAMGCQAFKPDVADLFGEDARELENAFGQLSHEITKAMKGSR